MRRYLPPILILLVLGIVAGRALLRPSRDEAQARIRALAADPTQQDDAADAIRAYLEAYDGLEDRWFAAESFLRAGRFQAGIAAVFDSPELASAPDTARRFGAMALEAVGWRDVGRTTPTAQEPHALVALVEGRIPWAMEELARRARTDELQATAPYLFQAIRYTDRGPLELLSDAYRAHPPEGDANLDPYQIAAAFTALGTEAYPERDTDIEQLIQVLKMLRRSNNDVWTASAQALGRSWTERGREALERHYAHLSTATTRQERRDATVLATALLTAGDWSKLEVVHAWLATETADVMMMELLADSLMDLRDQGDPHATGALTDLWNRMGTPEFMVRFRIAHRLLCPAERGEPGPEPIPGMLEYLDTTRDNPLLPGVANGYRLRTGAPGALDGSLAMLDIYASTLEEGEHRWQELMPAWIFALRCLVLYG